MQLSLDLYLPVRWTDRQMFSGQTHRAQARIDNYPGSSALPSTPSRRSSQCSGDTQHNCRSFDVTLLRKPLTSALST
ncbi:hypothetical protein CesoFtcFv8_023568 [Champsocephalus esox]|uniref:Uncharacterized protein n=1 Tax=Champsocephalus esox TaxID=159716 RepID=A0AAN8GK59_9TELE|nr:hypothetical protein CesoFtcFv8_023568 [Champsocephalus esox]